MKQSSCRSAWVTMSVCLCSLVMMNLQAVCSTDGFCWINAWWASSYDFNVSSRYWESGVIPHDGGVGYFTGTQSPNLKFAGTESLRGLDFGNVQYVASRSCPSITGSLTLEGDAFLSGTGSAGNEAACDYFANVAGKIQGTGDNVFTKKDRGFLLISTPLSNFGTVAAGGGRLVSTAISGSLFSDSGRQAVRGGTFWWQPAVSAGATAAASMRELTYGSLGGSVFVSKGNASNATLTLPSLQREDDGGTLWVRTSGGVGSLGETEKVVLSSVPEMVNGLLDPGIVTHDGAVESWPIRFTTYDSVKGIVPYLTGSMVDLAQASATDVARVDSATTLSQSKQVAALSVENSASLSIGEGVTLKVGDGSSTHQAGVIFNRSTKLGTNVAMSFEGAGTLDFGNSPGLIWTSMPTKDGWGVNRGVVVKTKITGAKGVTFASHSADSADSCGYFQLVDGYSDWNGPTRIVGGMLWVSSADALPAGDVCVLGGTGNAGGQFRPLSGGWTLNQNFFLSGAGPYGDGSCAIYLQDGEMVLNGQVTLLDDTVFRSGGTASRGGVKFSKGVRGPGSLILKNGGLLEFSGVNTFSDLVVSGASTIQLGANATFGSGRVWFKGGDQRIVFDRDCKLTSTNEFRRSSGSLTMSLDHGDVAFTKSVDVTTLALTNFASVAIGGTWNVGQIAGYGSRDSALGKERITAATRDAVLAVGSSSDAVLSTALADGSGTLSLVKQGSGTLEFPSDDERVYTGATTVKEGTLKLVEDPRASSSLLYWMDASREEDFVKDVETGVVSKWNSRAGKLGMSFVCANGTPEWGKEEVNGHAVLSTKKKDGEVPDRLVGSQVGSHRTVFVVARAKSAAANVGLIGQNGSDYGMRMSSNTYWEPNSGNWTLNTTAAIRLDGVNSTKPQVNVGGTHILTLIHDRDNWDASVSWGGKTGSALITPAIGWYYSSRNFEGDYCEILAFDRVLSEPEMRFMENYLSEKWMNRTLWSDTKTSPMLPTATALTVESGATVDLAGASIAVASLSGNGTITNSAATPATLTVTGNCNFTGRVSGSVNVSTAGEATLSGRIGAGVTLSPQSGSSLATGTHLLTPPTEGLAYWCDAGCAGTIVTDAAGGVTSWVSRVSSSAQALVANGGAPSYVANGLGGRPALNFGTTSSLKADVASPVRSIFIVAVANGNQTKNNGLWGLGGLDVGYRFVNNTTNIEGDDGCVRPSLPGNRVCVDGVSDGGLAIAFGNGVTRVFSARLDGSETYLADIGLGSPAARTTVIGKYSSNYSIVGFIGEVIAYDRVLSDGEMRQVEEYLMNKWQVTPWTAETPYVEAVNGFEGGGLNLSEGASVDLGAMSVSVGSLRNDGCGGSIAGNLTIENQFILDAGDRTAISPIVIEGNLQLGASAEATVLNYLNLNRTMRHNALSATESLSGDFVTVNGLVRRWNAEISGKGWYIFRDVGLAIIVR